MADIADIFGVAILPDDDLRVEIKRLKRQLDAKDRRIDRLEIALGHNHELTFSNNVVARLF